MARIESVSEEKKEKLITDAKWQVEYHEKKLLESKILLKGYQELKTI